jgi:hypothetical protein
MCAPRASPSLQHLFSRTFARLDSPLRKLSPCAPFLSPSPPNAPHLLPRTLARLNSPFLMFFSKYLAITMDASHTGGGGWAGYGRVSAGVREYGVRGAARGEGGAPLPPRRRQSPPMAPRPPPAAPPHPSCPGSRWRGPAPAAASCPAAQPPHRCCGEERGRRGGLGGAPAAREGVPRACCAGRGAQRASREGRRRAGRHPPSPEVRVPALQRHRARWQGARGPRAPVRPGRDARGGGGRRGRCSSGDPAAAAALRSTLDLCRAGAVAATRSREVGGSGLRGGRGALAGAAGSPAGGARDQMRGRMRGVMSARMRPYRRQAPSLTPARRRPAGRRRRAAHAPAAPDTPPNRKPAPRRCATARGRADDRSG